MKRINLSKFKSQIDPVILSRGKSYFQNGRVSPIETSEIGNYEFVVSGSEQYNVCIETDGDDVTYYSCDCPYEGSVCKHVTACLYHIEDEVHIAAELEKSVFELTEDVAAAQKNAFGFSETELYYLCYLVYSGKVADGHLAGVPVPDSMTRFTGKVQCELNESLCKEGWLEPINSAYPRYGYLPSPSRYYDIASELINNRNGWLAKFRYLIEQEIQSKCLFQTALILNGTDPALCPELSDAVYFRYVSPSDYFIVTLLRCIRLENGKKVIGVLSPVLLERIVNYLIFSMQCGTDGASDMLSSLFDCISTYSEELHRLRSIFRRDMYYMTGEKLTPIAGEAVFAPALYVRAVDCLYEGKIDESIELFKKGISIQNKIMKIKGMPQDDITLMLYSAALAIRHDDADMNALRIMSNKHRAFSGAFEANFILIDFLLDNSRVDVSGLERCCWYGGTSAVVAWLTSCLMRRNQEMKMISVPKNALLQCEMSAFIPGMDKGKWRYDPILSRIRIREPWEQKLEDLIGSAESANVVATSGTSDERLIYICGENRETVEVRLQNRLKSGVWGKGKSLSMIRYTTCDCPMDEIDKAIYAEWRKSVAERRYYSDSFPRLLDVAPFCKGTDRLYVRRGYNDYEPVTVVEDIPYLTTERKDGFISFKTNIPNSAWKYDCKFPYCWQPGNRLVLYNMPKTQLGMLHQVLELGKVPEIAEPCRWKGWMAIRCSS